MKRYIVIIALCLFQFAFFVGEALAQAPPPSSNPPGAPIDGLTGVLIAAGAAYGMRRMKDRR